MWLQVRVRVSICCIRTFFINKKKNQGIVLSHENFSHTFRFSRFVRIELHYFSHRFSGTMKSAILLSSLLGVASAFVVQPSKVSTSPALHYLKVDITDNSAPSKKRAS
jgi:hypothetical protein